MLKLIHPNQDNYLITPKSVCSLYLMLKLHFNGKYDVIHYNWKYSMSNASFNSRKDKLFFEKIAPKLTMNELVDLFVSALLSKTDNWIGGMTSARAIGNYKTYSTMLKVYDKELAKELEIMILYCKREGIKFVDLLKYDEKRDSARIIKMVKMGIIKYETFLIIDRIVPIIDLYDKKSECFEWMELSIVLNAYKKLLTMDKKLGKIFYDVVSGSGVFDNVPKLESILNKF